MPIDPADYEEDEVELTQLPRCELDPSHGPYDPVAGCQHCIDAEEAYEADKVVD